MKRPTFSFHSFNLWPIALLLAITLCGLVPTSCHYARPVNNSPAETDSTDGIDSTGFLLKHHYWRGDVFRTSDSLRLFVIDSPVRLLPQTDEADALLSTEATVPDTTVIAAAQRVAVTSILFVPDSTADSTWVYLTTANGTQGWTKEHELLKHAAPDDPISNAIHTLSKWHTPLNITGFAVALCALVFFTLRRRKHEPIPLVLGLQGSIYPIVLRLCVSTCALLYAAVWHFAPETWTEFYFNPTLNPFAPDLPLVLAVFLASGWLVLLASLAMLYDVWERLPPAEGVAYVLELTARCVVVFIAISLTTEYILVGYVLFALYWALLALTLWRVSIKMKYNCGRCGHPIDKVPGRCPHCGAQNKLPHATLP